MNRRRGVDRAGCTAGGRPHRGHRHRARRRRFVQLAALGCTIRSRNRWETGASLRNLRTNDL